MYTSIKENEENEQSVLTSNNGTYKMREYVSMKIAYMRVVKI